MGMLLILIVIAMVTGYVVAPRWWWRQSVMHAPPRAVFGVWGAFAKQRGLRVASQGMRIESRMPFMHGQLHGCEVELSVVAGRGAGFDTRLWTRARRPLDVHVRLEARRAPARSGLPPFETADEFFDSAFRSTADDAVKAGRLLEESVRAALLAISGYPHIEIHYLRGETEITWAGTEENPHALDHALAAGLALSHWHPVAGYRDA
ncbi:MAG TPA: hypothetical protein VNO21_22980 [Polyangiaceae bacterium]|nr:hypothetical protein [Polyangiaceae bacterium]